MATFQCAEDLEIKDVGDLEIQEVEIEYLPIDMQSESVGTTNDGIDIQSILSFSHLPEPAHEEVVLQPAEEVVDSYFAEDSAPFSESCSETPVAADYSLEAYDRRSRGRKRKGPRSHRSADTIITSLPYSYDVVNSDIKIKHEPLTSLDNDFTVTMWTSGMFTFILFLQGQMLIASSNYRRLLKVTEGYRKLLRADVRYVKNRQTQRPWRV